MIINNKFVNSKGKSFAIPYKMIRKLNGGDLSFSENFQRLGMEYGSDPADWIEDEKSIQDRAEDQS